MEKPIRITLHARQRMLRYGLEEKFVIQALREPDYINSGYYGRKIANKFMNEFVLRVIYEENNEIVVISVYPARRERYAKIV